MSQAAASLKHTCKYTKLELLLLNAACSVVKIWHLFTYCECKVKLCALENTTSLQRHSVAETELEQITRPKYVHFQHDMTSPQHFSSAQGLRRPCRRQTDVQDDVWPTIERSGVECSNPLLEAVFYQFGGEPSLQFSHYVKKKIR